MTNTAKIYRDVSELAGLDGLISDFNSKVHSAHPGRFAGICGFDGFIDNFVRLKAPAAMAEFGPKVIAGTLGERIQTS